MAKPLVLQFGDRDLPFDMAKIDRDKLYGFKKTEAYDLQGRRCELATLTNDGQTMVALGGTGMGYLNSDGEWYSKTDLTAVDAEGKPFEPVASSFLAPIKLFDTATVEDYLQHNIKSIYELNIDVECDDLRQELSKGTIFTFPFSYRGGIEADTAFLLTNEEGTLFLALGVPSKIEFVGLQTTVVSESSSADDEDENDDLMSFDMI